MPKETPHAHTKEDFKELELAVKTTKEIVIKFIEVDKISPASFPDVFNTIFETVCRAVKSPTGRSQA
ncbi:MAG: hypothetical protein PHC35_02160 [Deltaproteobacteria bacterium]|nr:hypothetical protein [Deltaproteobacteria bacterium]